MPSHKFRIRFAKRGDLRLISHHDLLRCLERALRRAGLPVAVSQGFTPRPKTAFAQALALGVEGRREVLEIELAEPREAASLGRALGAVLPAGFDLIEAVSVPAGRAARAVAADYHLPVPDSERAAIAVAIAEFVNASNWPAIRTRGERQSQVDIRPLVASASLDDQESVLRFRLVIDQAGSLRPSEWLEALGLDRLLAAGAILVRDDIVLADEIASASGPDSTPFPGPAATSEDDQGRPDHHPSHVFPIDEAELTCPPI